MNSSRLIPGPIRQLVGGRVYSSGDYRVLGTDGAAAFHASQLDGWHRTTVVKRQDRLWQRPAMWHGGRPDLRNLRRAVDYFASARSVLEVGCGTGYNVPVLAGHDAEVFGVDSSEPMVAGAHARFPGRFLCAQAAALPFVDSSIDLVVDAGALIHTVDWQSSLAQQARVARRGVVLHTVTVTDHPTTYLRKRAYGYPVAEVAINADELATCIASLGLSIVRRDDGILYDLTDVVGIPTRSQTWILELVDVPS